MMENRLMTGNRVDCLYRVSTDKQVDYNDKSQADIPMQRRECHRFCEKMGWTIVHEEQEDGVSGHKVRAENRDKLQIIKERAKQGKFDILLVFMFDRIGRIADETPFVVEWFVKNGIRVWSTQEGEQRFDNHTDKLTNYIRFWQADGESEKTSIRTKTALGQLVEDGGFKGGLAPYGYDLVKSGRFNKRKHEVFELAVNEAEAAVVRIIFDKYVHEGFGAQRIATYLNNLGYRARTGKMWHHASIRGIICNLTYTGVLRSGESRSQTLPHLQIITPELFEAAQHIRTSRANSAEQERRVPLNTRGQSLLAGNVFCGHCGSRLALTTNGKAYPCKEDAHRIVKRVRYICYGKTRKQTECDGQTGYTAHILDGIIDKVVRQIFERMKAIPKSEIVNIRYREKMEERKALLKSAKSDYAKAAAELDTLRAEVIKSLRGESAFSQDLLGSLISDCETKCLEVQHTMEAAQAAYDEGQAMLDALNAQYDDIISWADMYDSASMESKKMIVSCLIRRVVVAGLLYLVLALLFKLVGAKKVMRFFPPIVTGPIIILIGLNLSGTAVTNASSCWWLALVAIAIIIVANIWGKGMVKIIPILLGVVGSYVIALIATLCGAQLPDANGVMQPLINFAEVHSAGIVGLQKFVIAKFDVTSILVMAPIAIAAMMEHIGDVSAISSTTGKNFIEDPGLHRTLLGDGLATAFAGMFGGPANTTYGENTGVLALSRVYDPRVIRLAALYAIILSFSPKFDALVNSIPTAIVGGVSFVLYGMISAVGVRNVVENKVDLTKSRNLIIAAVIFVCGLGFASTGGITFTVGSADITLTGLAIAALAGVVLNALLPGNDYEFGKNAEGDASADLGSY